jgi:transposase InsO family protein
MDTDFCIDALEEALQRHGIQYGSRGVQFTCDAFTSVLKEHGIRISMNSKGITMRTFLWNSGAASNTSVSTSLPSKMADT